MGTTLKELFSPNVMLGVTDVLKGSLPRLHMPAGLFGDGTTTQPVIGDTGYIIRGTGTHRAAKQAARGSVARPRTINGMSKRPEVLLHSAESMEVKADDIRAIVDWEANPESSTLKVSANVAQSAIANIQRQAMNLQANLRTAAVTSAFALGHIYFDSDGEIVTSSGSATIDVDYGIPAGNRDQVSGIIDASWGTTSTKILKHIELLKLRILQQSGRTAAHCIYGKNILGYLLDNTQAKEYIMRNASLNQQVLGTTSIGSFQLGGLTWWPGYMGFHRDSSDSVATLIGDDAIIMFPEPSPDWYQMQEGFELVPENGFGRAMDLAELFASATPKQGMFQYAEGSTNPLKGTVIYGDNFLPAIHVPEAVIVADVTP